jgi:RNase P subunit RPR2
MVVACVRQKSHNQDRRIREMKTRLRMKCKACGHWNRVPVNKIFIEQPSLEPKVKVMIPMYEPLETSKCEKCGKIIAEPRELVRIQKATRT